MTQTAHRTIYDAPAYEPAELSDNSRHIMETRYLQRDGNGVLTETPEDLFSRVSRAVANGEDTPEAHQTWEPRFRRLMSTLRFLPNSPTLVNAGTDGRGCLSACFVVNPEDSMESIMQVAHDAAMIEKWGGGIGFGLSNLRPRKDMIKTTHGEACGPIAVMKLYSAVGATLTQGAFREGAHMAQMRDSHPDIREFIHCKDNDDTLANFNISVQITDAFMDAVADDDDWHLINPRNDEVVETVSARELWDEICESAWKTGDPGVVFIDRVWNSAPNPQMGKIESSNPCGEEMLENYGNCCLGSINLAAHISGGQWDMEDLERTVRTAVRFLDDVININVFPLDKLREVNLATRRIGLGVMGWADALVERGMPYDSPEAIEEADCIGGFIRDTAWNESEKLAEERGAYPEYERSRHAMRGRVPVRHSSVTTVAPTGTISRLAGCSSGIEPHFALAYWSNVLWKQEASQARLLDAPDSVRKVLNDDALSILIDMDPADRPDFMRALGVNPDVLRTSMEISPEAHVKMHAAWQRAATNSVSKTINLPNSATVKDIAMAYQLAYETGCKSTTVYRDGSKSMQVLETGSGSEAVEEAPAPMSERPRPESVRGVTDLVRTGHGNMYVNITFDDDGNPFEVFSTVGKAGGCDSANLEAVARLVSMALRSGIDAERVVGQLSGITCCPAWHNGELVRSAPDAMAYALRNHIREHAGEAVAAMIPVGQQSSLFDTNGAAPAPATAVHGAPAEGARRGPQCPKCYGPNFIYEEGCHKCYDCGHSKCG